jgi:tight adherence protein B
MGLDSVFILQIIIILVLAASLFYLVKFNLSLKLSRRISRYSIEPLNNNQLSLFDGIFILYKKLLNAVSTLLINSKMIEHYSHKYDKYTDYLDERTSIDYVSNKVLIAISFIAINFFANVLEMDLPTIYEIILVAIIGFYVPDLYMMYKNYARRLKIERDLLNAIIMLNNAFKSGRSTMQAIEIVKNEMEGPIKEEFLKMYTEISYGLSLESVFKRFSERVKVEEISYITSSLTILNKTGGNIVKVFSSIERSLFSKNKLESELRALTASSRVMSRILLFLPIFFAGVIMLLNPTYFNSLFDNLIGLTILFCIILFYALYAFFVQKVMRVRM